MFLQEPQHLEARRAGKNAAPDPIIPLPHESLSFADWLVWGAGGESADRKRARLVAMVV